MVDHISTHPIPVSSIELVHFKYPSLGITRPLKSGHVYALRACMRHGWTIFTRSVQAHQLLSFHNTVSKIGEAAGCLSFKSRKCSPCTFMCLCVCMCSRVRVRVRRGTHVPVRVNVRAHVRVRMRACMCSRSACARACVLFYAAGTVHADPHLQQARPTVWYASDACFDPQSDLCMRQTPHQKTCSKQVFPAGYESEAKERAAQSEIAPSAVR